MILRYILWLLLAYFLYKFVFEFIVPLLHATRQIKRQANDFHSRMQQQQQEPMQQSNFTKTGSSSPKEGDYIDFEEVK